MIKMNEYLIYAIKNNPRKGEGDIVVLKDGTLLLVYTEFYEGSSDFSPARIVAHKSYNNGESWSKKYVLQENIGKNNVMSVSLLRLKNGNIAFAYGVKNSFEDLKFYLRISEDEAETWSEPIAITTDNGYFVMNNDRLVQLNSGRIIAPVSTYQDIKEHSKWKSFIYYSDDNGKSWHKGISEVRFTERIKSRVGLQEPGIVELRDGTLMMYMRTGLGYIYVCYSDDEGEHWSNPEPLDDIKSPTSPSTIKRIPSTGDLMLIWNDKRIFQLETLTRRGDDIIDKNFQHRAPLTLAISKDEGATWHKVMDLEPSLEHTYCYTSVTFKENFIFLSYYYDFSHLKIVRLTIDEIYSF